MRRNHPRVRVERNLYRAGSGFYACATPPGGRQAVWQALGEVGIMEARRRRDEFVASVRRSSTPTAPSRAKFGEIAEEWLATQMDRVALDELAPRTLEAYEGALNRYILPVLGQRPVQSISADDLVAWHRGMRKRGLARATVVSRGHRSASSWTTRFATTVSARTQLTDSSPTLRAAATTA